MKKKSPYLVEPIEKSYQTNSYRKDRDKLIEYLYHMYQYFCMYCSDYACKSAQYNLYLLFALYAGHSYVHDREELSSSILQIMI